MTLVTEECQGPPEGLSQARKALQGSTVHSEYIYTVQGGPCSSGTPGTWTTLINDPQQPAHGYQSHTWRHHERGRLCGTVTLLDVLPWLSSPSVKYLIHTAILTAL